MTKVYTCCKGNEKRPEIEKTVALKPQSVEEAILQMNLLGHQFYMFLNADTGIVNVVYRRKDSGYGLIIPDYDD